MDTLKRWFLDWTGRSGIPPREALGNPVELPKKILESVAALVLLASAPAVAVFLPDINPNQKIALYVVIALAALAAVHHVLTARDRTPAQDGAAAAERYRYTATERTVARGVVVVPLVLLAIGLIPAPAPERACDLDAVVRWTAGPARPLVLTVNAGGGASAFPVFADQPVALSVPPPHASPYELTLEWSDGTRSSFGRFDGCAAVSARATDDGRATVDLSPR